MGQIFVYDDDYSSGQWNLLQDFRQVRYQVHGLSLRIWAAVAAVLVGVTVATTLQIVRWWAMSRRAVVSVTAADDKNNVTHKQIVVAPVPHKTAVKLNNKHV